jgi:hypothetical protein
MKFKPLSFALAFVCLQGGASAQQLITVDDYPVTPGFVIRDYPSNPGTPLLSWFHLWYVFSDHHLENISVLPIGDDIQLSLLDEDGNDTIGYTVGHYLYPDVPWESVSDTCSGGLSCVVQLAEKPDDSEFVLVGFDAEFTNGDHHLRQLSIFESEGKLVVWFGDQYFDDPIAFRVDFSWIPRKQVLSQGHWGNGSGSGHVYAPFDELPKGPVVLQGFAANYLDDDHHLAHLAVSPDEVRLSDKNCDDSMAGQVKWLELAPDESGQPPPIDVKGDYYTPPLVMDPSSEPSPIKGYEDWASSFYYVKP